MDVTCRTQVFVFACHATPVTSRPSAIIGHRSSLAVVLEPSSFLTFDIDPLHHCHHCVDGGPSDPSNVARCSLLSIKSVESSGSQRSKCAAAQAFRCSFPQGKHTWTKFLPIQEPPDDQQHFWVSFPQNLMMSRKQIAKERVASFTVRVVNYQCVEPC